MAPEAREENWGRGRRFYGQCLDASISSGSVIPSLSLSLSAFSFGARNREKGCFSGGERSELRTLERELVPGQLSRLQCLLLGAESTGWEDSGK